MRERMQGARVLWKRIAPRCETHLASESEISPVTLGDDALEWCMASVNQQELRKEFSKIVHADGATQALNEALNRVGVEAKTAGCRPEDLLILVREAWSQGARPPAIGEDAWSRVYHEALATCLTAYFRRAGF